MYRAARIGGGASPYDRDGISCRHDVSAGTQTRLVLAGSAAAASLAVNSISLTDAAVEVPF